MPLNEKLAEEKLNAQRGVEQPHIIYPDKDDSYTVHDRMSRMAQISRIAHLPVETSFNGIPFVITPDVRADQYDAIYKQAMKYHAAKRARNAASR